MTLTDYQPPECYFCKKSIDKPWGGYRVPIKSNDGARFIGTCCDDCLPADWPKRVDMVQDRVDIV